jgi:hypothetical protein
LILAAQIEAIALEDCHDIKLAAPGADGGSDLLPLQEPKRPRGPSPRRDTDLETVLIYGREELKMTNVAMAREIGLSAERIRQILARAGHTGLLCACGRRRAANRESCGNCLPKSPPPPRGTLCAKGCGRKSLKGDVCFKCRQKTRYRDDPEWRRVRDLWTKRWKDKASRDPEKLKRLRASAQRAHKKWAAKQPKRPHRFPRRGHYEILRKTARDWPVGTEITTQALIQACREKRPDLASRFSTAAASSAIGREKAAGRVVFARRLTSVGTPIVWKRVEDSWQP